jgi:histone deacetylase complex subunit SAP18
MGPGRFLTKDVGNIVIGAGLDGAKFGPIEGDGIVTLSDVNFVIGDYVACAILPPTANGETPAPLARVGRPDMGMGGRPRQNGFGPPAGRGGGDRGGGSGRGIPAGDWRRGDEPPSSSGFYRGRGRSRGW